MLKLRVATKHIPLMVPSMLRSLARASDHVRLPALFLALLGTAAGMQIWGNDYVAGLGANLLAEFVGAAVTVYGIDVVLRRREEKRLLPVKAAAYEDVRIMTHWALDLWRSAYLNSVGDSEPQSWTELFSPSSVQKVLVSLDVAKPANTLPAQSWGSYFDIEMERIHRHAEKVLERHGGALDPSVHNAVYSIVYYKHHPINNLIGLDRREGIPRPTNLGAYVPEIREWFDAILTMHQWTITVHPDLLQHGISTIHQPYSFNPLDVKTDPPARLSEDALMRQVAAMREWQSRK